ncbi:MAG: hypothetical protein QOI38_1670 [Sphingomonadales bacterium]|nr:hypothetical protein [Sphingomonadales bacterium]
MPSLFFADLVRERSHGSGTGPLALAGAATGHRGFADVVPPGATFHYAIAGVTHPGQWETGEGSLDASGALLRTPNASSEGGDPVDFLAGTKIVTLTVGAGWFASQQEALGGKAALTGAAFTGPVSAPSLTLATPLALDQGGTGASSAAAARAALGLGSAAQQQNSAFVAAAERGAAGGVATLDAGGKVPSAQLPPGGGVSSVNGQSGAVTLTAAAIGSSAAGDVAATNVQAAIAELAAEKAPLSAPAFTGTVTMAGQAVVGGTNPSGTYKLSIVADGPGISVAAPSSSFASPAIGISRATVTCSLTATSAACELGSQSGHDVIVRRAGSEKLRIQGSGIAVTGSADVSQEYRQNGVRVVGGRAAGWSAATGTASRGAFDTGTVSTVQLAERLKALIDDLLVHGLIGA